MNRAKMVATMLGLLLIVGLAPWAANALAPEVRNVGPVVNSPASDFAPTISPDGGYLFFASDRGGGAGGQDIYVSRKGLDGWETPVNLGSPINNKLNQGPDSFLMENGRQYLFLTFCKPMDEDYCDIYMTEMLPDGSWTRPKDLGSPINTAYSDSNASWDYRDKYMYFSSTRPGGVPGPGAAIPKDASSYDIWRIKMNDNGSWGTPENLGNVINTPGWEGVAFFHTASRRLYFSSNGHHGRDDADVYYSTESSPGVWSRPQPVDAVNTPGNDMYFQIPAAGDLVYFSSNYHGGELPNYGLEDIYVLPIDIAVKDWQPQGGGCTSHCCAKECGCRPDNWTCPGSPICGQGHPCEACKLDEIFFNAGSSLIRASEYDKIRAVADYLACNPEVRISVEGFASREGSEWVNARLSYERAQEVANYLACYGVDPSRIVVSNYGECSAEKGVRAKDRRVEIYTLP